MKTPVILIHNMEPVFGLFDDCVLCRREVELKVFSTNYSIAMYCGEPVSPEWQGEWAGFNACKDCYDKVERGEVKFYDR